MTTAAQPNVFTRDDTFFGVCQAIGEDFGFSPNWLRLAIGVGLLFAPLATIGAYLGAGLLVGFSRLLSPDPRRAAAPAAEAVEKAETPRADNETLADTLAVAASALNPSPSRERWGEGVRARVIILRGRTPSPRPSPGGRGKRSDPLPEICQFIRHCDACRSALHFPLGIAPQAPAGRAMPALGSARHDPAVQTLCALCRAAARR